MTGEETFNITFREFQDALRTEVDENFAPEEEGLLLINNTGGIAWGAYSIVKLGRLSGSIGYHMGCILCSCALLASHYHIDFEEVMTQGFSGVRTLLQYIINDRAMTVRNKGEYAVSLSKMVGHLASHTAKLAALLEVGYSEPREISNMLREIAGRAIRIAHSTDSTKGGFSYLGFILEEHRALEP